jgi:hypothetical protein
MQTDGTFVKANFQDAYIRKLKQVRKGFVDIPVGDFKVSHLSVHPSLHIHGAPRVCFPQTDGQDLCVSMSLASALYSLGFQCSERVMMEDDIDLQWQTIQVVCSANIR